MTEGDTKTLTATAYPSTASNRNITWSTSNTNIASVNNSGTVTAVAAGTATITATGNDGCGVKATCTVTVMKKVVKVTSITLSKTTESIVEGGTSTLTATVAPNNADDKTVNWSSSNTAIATVSNGVVTAVAPGTATITATANDGSGVKATCEVTVTSKEHEYVDLGLPSGTLWAKTNIGATNIYDYGDYFAWGETIGFKGGKTKFSDDTYKYYKSMSSTTKDSDGFYITITTNGYTKYVTQSDASKYGYDGFYDNKNILEVCDDAAIVNWGDMWSTPSISQWQELKKNCTWTWAVLNGVGGYKVSGTNGNYIFLPSAGSHDENGEFYIGTNGFYWTNELYSKRNDFAYYFAFVSDQIDYNNGYGTHRYNGFSIRPVRVK